jgi:Tfp pilus assembly protein PilF
MKLSSIFNLFRKRDKLNAQATPKSKSESSARSEEYLRSGMQKALRNDCRGALIDLDQAIQLTPSNPSPYVGRAKVKAQLMDFQGELDDYTKAIELDPSNGEAYFSRGIAYLRT